MIKLGENVYNVPPPLGMRSFAFQQRILPVAGRVINVFLHLVGNGTDATGLLESDVARVLPQALPFIGQIFSEMPEGELEKITRELLKDATRDKAPLFNAPLGGDPFDEWMRGKTVETWKLLWHAIQVWYPDVFTLAAAFTASGAKENRSEESTTSQTNGPAGG